MPKINNGTDVPLSSATDITKLKSDTQHFKDNGLDSGALYKRICKYLAAFIKMVDNPPLSLEELRKDTHSPLYIICPKHRGDDQWIIGDGWDEDFDELRAANGDGWYAGCYGIAWLAYRRKPGKV